MPDVERQKVGNGPDNPDIAIQELRKLYASSIPLMNEAMSNHGDTQDFICALRWVLNANPELRESIKPYTDGLARLAVHIGDLQRLAMSYHKAIGDL